MKRALIIAFAVLFIPLVAFGVTKGQQNIYVGEDEIVNDNYYAFGNTVTIDGIINGDLFAFGKSVTVNGDVIGDVIAGGDTITLNGIVEGNIRVAGSNVDINSQVTRNVHAFGGAVTIGSNSDIGWTLTTGATAVDIRGTIHGNVLGYGGNFLVGANISNNATFTYDTESVLTILDSTTINGDLTYTSEQTADIEQGATIEGQTVHQIPTPSVQRTGLYLGSLWFVFKLVALFALLFAGVLVISLFPKELIGVIGVSKARPAKSLLTGLITVIVTPFAILILFISLIGIPVGLIMLALYLIILFLVKIVIGTLIGQSIIRLFKKNSSETPPLIWPMLLGTTLFYAVTNIPFIGWLLGMVGVIWGFGAIVEHIRESRGTRQT